MIGSLVTRSLALVLGYAYPAYECFKTVELNKPDIEQLLFWCQYWILVAVLTVFERLMDNFISWIPMYGEAKLAFFIYLWCPKTKGTTYIYETFFRPYVSKHENEIDRNLLELRTRAGDFVILHMQKVISYGQTRIFEILQYVASQSATQPSRGRPVEQSQSEKLPQGQALSLQNRRAKSTTAAHEPAAQVKQVNDVSTSSSRIQGQESVKVAVPPTTEATAQASTSLSQPNAKTTAPQPTEGEKETSEVVTVNASDKETPNEDANAPPEETPIAEAIRVTRARLRKRVATAGQSAR